MLQPSASYTKREGQRFMSSIQVFLIVLAVIAVIALIAWQAKVQAERERRRRAALAHFAGHNGMQFSQDDRWDLDARYRGVGDIGTGHDRYAFDVIRLDEPPLTVFQYHYKTWETRTVRRGDRTVTERYEKDHWCKYLVLEETCFQSSPTNRMITRVR